MSVVTSTHNIHLTLPVCNALYAPKELRGDEGHLALLTTVGVILPAEGDALWDQSDILKSKEEQFQYGACRGGAGCIDEALLDLKSARWVEGPRL
jgi:hypothetical protein